MKKSALFSLLALCMAFSTQCLALGFPNAPFNKGVNLSDWFNHEDSKYLRYDTYTSIVVTVGRCLCRSRCN